jgi:hypothetical protein
MSPNKTTQDQAATARLWSLLAEALARSPLPSAGGGTIRCTADDFMLMVEDDGHGRAGFKNSLTRNYVYLDHDSGALYIPKTTQYFLRGEFASYTQQQPTAKPHDGTPDNGDDAYAGDK